MNRLWIPILLSAFVMPGAGQLYNKERAKGLVLILLTLGVMAGFSIGLALAMSQILPPGAIPTELEMRAMATRLSVERATFFSSFGWLTFAIWAFGVLDAYWGARDRIRRETASLPEPDKT